VRGVHVSCQAFDELSLHRKKKSSKSKAAKDPEALLERDTGAVASSSSRVLDANPDSDKTASEKRFEAEQLKRVRVVNVLSMRLTLKSTAQLAAKVAKDAKKSHKDRVAEFNAKLEALSEVSLLFRELPPG
jgi:protein FAM32A